MGAGSGEQGSSAGRRPFSCWWAACWSSRGGCPRPPEEVRPEVRAVCDYLEAHCDRRITLEQLSTLAGLSKYHLLRCFTRQKGITPYRYLETVRVNRARALLEQGAAPLDAALRAGFADQSHFNHFFKILTGLTPSQYRAVFAAERGEP
ncbi:MAG: helix-turn-helix domain-containing protein [Flavonifractor plautii]